MEMNTERKRILFADDDPEIREVVRILLEHEGFEVIEASNGKEAVEKSGGSVDLIILDVMMPGKSGILACLEIRKKLTVPILFLTARTQDSDKALGFCAGGDDYLAKPFSYAELAARVKSHLRRYTSLGDIHAFVSAANIVNGKLMFNGEEKVLYADGEPIKLTATETKIVDLFMHNLGRIFPAEEIYRRVWNEEAYAAENTVMVHIRRIREKIEYNPKEPEYLKVVWGIGYKMEKK